MTRGDWRVYRGDLSKTSTNVEVLVTRRAVRVCVFVSVSVLPSGERREMIDLAEVKVLVVHLADDIESGVVN
jgi:hypothetical protein